MAGLTSNPLLIAWLSMECSVELTEAEKKTLRQLPRRHPHQDFRTRGLGLLELARGRRVSFPVAARNKSIPFNIGV
jgi:hypothetical protein